MMNKLASLKERRKVESMLLVSALVAMSVVIFIPMSAPPAKAQVIHDLISSSLEDNNPMYDVNPMVGVVGWAGGIDHIVTVPVYTVDAGFSLWIDPLHYLGNPPTDPLQYEITMQAPGGRIDVEGMLSTTDNFNQTSKNGFVADVNPWDGIYFKSGSTGNIIDCWIRDAQNGVTFEPGSTMFFGGVNSTRIDNIQGGYGLRLDGVMGETDIVDTLIEDTLNSGVPLTIKDSQVNITRVTIMGHQPGLYGLHINNSAVILDDSGIDGLLQTGSNIFIERYSNGTVISSSVLTGGTTDDTLILVEDGASPLVENCTLDASGKSPRAVWALDKGATTHTTVVNPTRTGGPGIWDNSFDNTSFDVFGGNTVHLEWFLNVQVKDPDNNDISGSTVTVSPPSLPSSRPTDVNGWASYFRVREFTQDNIGKTYYNPFNVSAVNITETGYADPEPSFNMSKVISITVPFPGVIQYQLKKGWNMISVLPYVPDPTLGTVLSTISGDYDAVQSYNASQPSDPWKHYKPAGKPFGNDMDTITHEIGVVIHMTSDGVLTPAQNAPSSGDPIAVPLFTGWNFIGYPSTVSRSPSAALSGVPYETVQTYDEDTGIWLSYDGAGPYVDNLGVMELGKGYWIRITTDLIWVITY